MEIVSFIYEDARGQTKAWRLAKWSEVGKYLQGVCVEDRKFRTFRKDRIVSYDDGAEHILFEPWVAPPPKLTSKPDILFTGFPKARRAELEALAEAHGMVVRKTVTKGLVFLCCGANAGPTKIEAARDKGCFLMLESAFLLMLETGEVEELVVSCVFLTVGGGFEK